MSKAQPATESQSKRRKQPDAIRKRTSAEQRAEIERVAREHGADLSEERFNEALRKVGARKA